MSVLIAYKKNDIVYMGTDAKEIFYDRIDTDACESNFKIQKMENGMLVGLIGDIPTRQILFAYPEIFTLDKKGELNRKHIVKEIIPALLSLLNEESLLDEKEDSYPKMKADILLAHNGVLYEITNSFMIIRYEDYQAIGSASELVQATIDNTKPTDDVNERIVRALNVASLYHTGVGAPFVLIDTKDQQYKIVGGNN